MDHTISQPGSDGVNISQNIANQKERAREVLATSINNAQPDAPTSNSSAPALPRHDSLNRKRSRSGSRHALTSRNPSIVQTDAQIANNDLLLQRHLLREHLDDQALIDIEDDKARLFDDIVEETEWWQKMRKSNRNDSGWVYGEGYRGYGNGWTVQDANHSHLPKLLYPAHHKRPGRRKTRPIRPKRKDRDAQKERPENLVPIRLDLEIEKLRLRDTFTWNLNDRIVHAHTFAQGLIEDFQVPDELRKRFLDEVYATMQEQIQDFHPHLFIEEDSLAPHLPYSAYKNDDMRILVKLNITIGSHSLIDQFEWDINNPTNSPEDFAKKMAADLCLSGEFMTAIAHSIHEQTQTFTKSLFIAGHPFDGRMVEEIDLRDNMQPTPLSTPFRAYQAAREFAPIFYELSEADLERTEDAFLREQRQQKRSTNRKGGPTLPELKERLRTVRTMVVSSVVPGAADSIEDSGLYRPTRRTGRAKKSYRIDDEGSDLSLSEEDSAADEPALPGPSRIKRGAASAAQAAMRAAQPGSLTPEFQQPRPKKYGYTYESNPLTGESAMILRLKMPRSRFRDLCRELKRKEQETQQQVQQPQPGVRSETPRRAPDASMPPPGLTTLLRTSSNDPLVRASHGDGANDTPPSSRPSQQPSAPPPPTPAWLPKALEELMQENPGESYTGVMRWSKDEGTWQPRIKCLDCANNIQYKTDPAEPTRNFRAHIANEAHKQKVAEKNAARGNA